jgi:iron-sulfur cluster assembly accessory protein
VISITPKAVTKIQEALEKQDPKPVALRLGVMGGGCSGFQYSMQWENEKGSMDKEFDFEGLELIVDATSFMYLDGCEIDYLETLEESGFKFNNPNVKSTCGCGKSFQT